MRQFSLHFFKPKPSIASLVNQIPEDGCLFVFNGRQNTWRTAVSRVADYTDRIIHLHKISGEKRAKFCDMYITISNDQPDPRLWVGVEQRKHS